LNVRTAIRLLVVCLLVFPAAAQLRVPVVHSIYPPSGPVDGGTFVTIRGSYFQELATVTIGGAPLENIVVADSGTIRGTTTARIAGVVNVFVTNPDGAATRLVKAYTYTNGSCCSYPSFATTALSGASTWPPSSVTAGSFVGLGIPDDSNDIVAAAADFHALYPGNGTAGFTPAQTFTSTGNVAGMEIYDANGDSIEDLAMAPLGAAIKTYLGGGLAVFSSTLTTTSTAYAFSLDSGDFNEDGVVDLVIPDHVGDQVRVCLVSLGGGGCSASNTYTINNPSGVVTGHFNPDRHVDFAVSNEDAGTVTVFLGNGTGSFSPVSPIAAGTSTTDVMGLATGFFNGDGVLDLVAATGAVLLGNNDGTFTAAPQLPFSSGRHVAVSDFNRDGHRDVAIDTSQTAVHILLGDGQGNFVDGPAINTAGGLYDAFYAFDIEGDGQVDMVIGGAPVVARNTVTACPTMTIGPSLLPEGEQGDAYSVTFSQTGGAGPVTYELTGELPAGLVFFGGTLSGTPTEVGIFPLIVKAIDANGCTAMKNYQLTVSGDTPIGLVATADNLGVVHLTWLPSSGADYYQVTRSSNGSAATVIGSPTQTSFTDLVAAANTTHVYRVRAVRGASTSADSKPDIATTLVFQDATLAAGATTIKAVHITQLRTAVNAVRAAASLAAFNFMDTTLTGTHIKAVHVQELRNALNEARAAIGVGELTRLDSLLPGYTIVRALHVEELRDGVK
jgi:IPT/TIG domain/FG-GAP-like repeat